MKSPRLLHHGLESPDSSVEQVAPTRHEADGAPQVLRELTPDEARAFMDRAFADLAQRRRNAAILAAAKVDVTHE